MCIKCIPSTHLRLFCCTKPHYTPYNKALYTCTFFLPLMSGHLVTKKYDYNACVLGTKLPTTVMITDRFHCYHNDLHTDSKMYYSSIYSISLAIAHIPYIAG